MSSTSYGGSGGPTLQLPPLSLIHSEIHSLLSAMRKNSRWASGSAVASGNPTSRINWGYSVGPWDGFAPGASAGMGGAGGRRGSDAGTGNTALASSMGLRGVPASANPVVAAGGASSSATQQGLTGVPGGDFANRAGTPIIDDASGSGTSTPNNWKGKERVGGVGMGVTGNRSSGGPQEGWELMEGLMALRAELREADDITTIPLPILLSPFLAVLTSPRTPGPITSLALSSLQKFLTYQVINPRCYPRSQLEVAMSDLAHAVTHCKFEASDGVGDEIVLARILEVVREAVCAGAAFDRRGDKSPTTVGGKEKEVMADFDRWEENPPNKIGDILTDEAICEIMETGLSMCCQMRLSEMLRRLAERTMQSMVGSVFTRLRDIEVPPEEHVSLHASSSPLPPRATTPDPLSPPSGLRMAAPDPTGDVISPAATGVMSPPPAGQSHGVEGVSIHGNSPTPTPSSYQEEKEEPEDYPAFKPYGLASISELFRVLISLLNPHDQQHTDWMRLMALGMVNIALEVAGKSIGTFKSLKAMVEDGLCKHVFQLARSDNPVMLSAALRTISTTFDTLRPHLKLQQELFYSFLLDRLIRPLPFSSRANANPTLRKSDIERELDYATWDSDNAPVSMSTLTPQSTGAGSGTGSLGGGGSGGVAITMRGSDRGNKDVVHGEARDLMLETVGHYARGPMFMVDLWVNYDSNVECEDLFERLVRFLCRGVFPSHSGGHYMQDNSQLLALDTILAFISHMANRLDWSPADMDEMGNAPSADELLHQKGSKRILIEGAARFNEKPKEGLRFLEEHGMIYNDPSITRTEALAHFLKTTPLLDKRVLGDYISRPDQIPLLNAFISLLEFEGKNMADAMRDMLEAFRLPGEAQPIARVTEAFSEIYFASGPAEIKSKDAAYVLAYSVIMLNTDLHNPQNRNRMTIEDYRRNLRGVNDGSDFTPDYLKSIYDQIRKREIVMPQEHHGQLGFEYAWKELLRRSRTAGRFVVCKSSLYDGLLFGAAWRPLISSIGYAFTHFQDEMMLHRVISGFRQCANLASRFEMPQVFDYLVECLSKITGLTQSSNTPDAFPSVTREGQKVTVSPLSIRFGTNFKAQLAAVVLFTIANNNGSWIREGWTHIFEIYETLFIHSLLPQQLLSMEDFLSGDTAIPLRPKALIEAREDRRSDGGLLSTLSSYLLSPSANVDGLGRDVTDEDVESTLCAVEGIAACRIDEIYGQIFTLNIDARMCAMRALLALLQKTTYDKLKGRTISGANTPTNSPAYQMQYDPGTVFFIEVLISIASRSEDAIVDVWPAIFDHLSRILTSAQVYSVLMVERAVAGLLRLVALVTKHSDFKDQLFLVLDVFRSLPEPVLSTVAGQVMTGTGAIISENPGLVRTTTEWNLVFALVGSTLQQEEAAKASFGLVQALVQGKISSSSSPPTGITQDNYLALVEILNAFGTAAGGQAIGDDLPQQRGRQAVELLRDVQAAIPGLISSSSLESNEAWEAYWIPLLSANANQCVNASRHIRQSAISSLQRTLLAPEILSNESISLTILFEKILFPLLEELLKPQVFRRDPEGMSETRLRSSALLCKIFLHYLVFLTERQGMERMLDLWLRILEFQDRFMHSGRRDQMFEAVPESLKNVLLVMNASGFLIPPQEQQKLINEASSSSDQSKIQEVNLKSRLWNSTFERIDTFLPNLKLELFPPVADGSSGGDGGRETETEAG